MLSGNILEGQVLSLKNAIDQGLRNNEDIRIGENNLGLSTFKIKEAYANLFPSISAFGQFQKRRGGQFIEQQAQFVNDALTDNFFGSIDASITLFDGLRNVNAIHQSKFLQKSNQEALKRTKQDVVFRVSSQYLECLLQKELVEIVRNNLNTQQTILEKIEEEVRLGIRPEIDLLLQRSEVAKMNLELTKAIGVLNTSKFLLSDLIGMKPTFTFEVEEPDFLDQEAIPMSIDSARIPIERRSDFLKSLHDIEAAAINRQVASAQRWPRLSAFYSINSGYNSGFINDFARQIDDNRLNEYGLRLSIPIFDGLKNIGAQKTAQVTYDNALLANQKLERQIKQEILRAQQSYQEAYMNNELSIKQLEYAEEAYLLETERLNLGMSDVERYSRATEEIVKSRSQMVQSKYTLMFQKIFLEYTAGTLSTQVN